LSGKKISGGGEKTFADLFRDTIFVGVFANHRIFTKLPHGAKSPS